MHHWTSITLMSCLECIELFTAADLFEERTRREQSIADLEAETLLCCYQFQNFTLVSSVCDKHH